MIAAAVLIAFMQSGLAANISPGPAPGSFYDPGPALHGKPGTLIRSEPMHGGPAGTATFRILYRSTNPDGHPIAVSGVVIVPAAPPPPGGRDVVAWAHPTTGIATRCAPSILPNVWGQIPGLADLLRRGYAVAATDYPGLGTVGIHPYLVGQSEARAVIDSVRAAREMQPVAATGRYAVWGHSQGAHAALWTGEIAAAYAPELQLKGVAAAAPPTNLGVLVDDDINTTGGIILTAYTLWSWSAFYGINGADAVYPSAIPPVEEIGARCVGNLGREYELAQLEAQLLKRFLKIDPAITEPWAKLLKMNSTGTHPPGAPVFVSQGLRDSLVVPSVTLAYVNSICARRAPVHYLQLPNADHVGAAEEGAAPAAAWIADRFAGLPAPTDCR